MSIALVIHGHFYQPPRENPWTDFVDREPSAHPAHDWNARVNAECYRPNGCARVVDGYGRIERIVNNYRHLSFNFGPTLLSWLEEHDLVTYERILQADRDSIPLRGGHGNGIAQAYNHPILPLCNPRDMRTQVRWGIADFQHRFKRFPESLWCSETAVNDAVMGVLIEEGMKYVILSPYQAERVRPLDGEWQDVGDGSVDPRAPYRYFHRDGSGRSMAVFFYDGPVARSFAFEGALNSSQALAKRLTNAGGSDDQLVHIATDGESYGHHTKFGDRSLAHAMDSLLPNSGFHVTNYAEFLEHHPPTMEVEIKLGPNGEGTAWSCAHGVGRWYRDCGCETGGRDGWNQAWRKPLRDALDYLRDEAIRVFETQGRELMKDPWDARDAYVSVILDGGKSRDAFVQEHAIDTLDEQQQQQMLSLLEMQRNALLMYTSCGWFFNELSGIETVQVMKYAGRVLDIFDELDVASARAPFLEMLAEAKSNIPEMGSGSDIFRRFVDPCRVTPQSVAAHLGISSIVNGTPDEGDVAGHHYTRSLYRKEARDRLVLATCRVTMQNIATGRRSDFSLAGMHFGGIDFYCLIRPFPGPGRFRQAANRLWEKFEGSSLPVILHLAEKDFGPDEYGLEHVLPEGRQRIAEIVFSGIVGRFSDYIARLYEDNQHSIRQLQNLGYELPRELLSAAEFTLGRRFQDEVQLQHESQDPESYNNAIEIASEVARHGFQIESLEAGALFDRMIAAVVHDLINSADPELARTARNLVDLTRSLGLRLNLERAQEILFEALPTFPLSSGEPVRQLALTLGLSPNVLDSTPAPAPAA